MRNNKRLLIIGVAILVVLVFLMVNTFLNRNVVRLEVVVAPDDSTLYVDGKKTKPGKITFTKEKHTLKATHQYFTDAILEIDARTIDKSKTIYLTPSPDSDEALKWLEENSDAQLQREAAGAARDVARQEAIKEKYPYISQLPHSAIDFKVDYSINSANDISFTVTLSLPGAVEPGTTEYDQEAEYYKQEALDYLESIGVDTDKANITYKNEGF